MAQSVNLFTSGWKATGASVAVPQFELTVRFEYTTEAGVVKSGARTVRFPNVLAQLPADVVAEKMTEMLIEWARRDVGVDT